MKLERVQRKATKFILSNYSLDYKSRLIQLDMLPLMYLLEIQDILFCIRSLKNNGDHLARTQLGQAIQTSWFTPELVGKIGISILIDFLGFGTLFLPWTSLSQHK